MSEVTDPADRELVASFSAEEARLLSGLAQKVVELLEGRGEGGSDPVLKRLLPDAYRDNPDDSAEFRRFTETDLVERKVRNALTMSGALSVPPGVDSVQVRMDFVAAHAWLRTLTDIRLGLAVRLGIESDDVVPDLDEEGEAVYQIYYWLGALQESLVAAVDVDVDD